MQVHVCHSMQAEGRGQLAGVGSLPPPHESRRGDGSLSCQAGRQALSPAVCLSSPISISSLKIVYSHLWSIYYIGLFGLLLVWAFFINLSIRFMSDIWITTIFLICDIFSFAQCYLWKTQNFKFQFIVFFVIMVLVVCLSKGVIGFHPNVLWFQVSHSGSWHISSHFSLFVESEPDP